MDPRGRGRARGRGRDAPGGPGGQPPQQQRGGRGGAGGGRPGMPPQPQQPQQPHQATWSRAPMPQQPAAWGVRPQLPTPHSTAGRGSKMGAGDTPEVSSHADVAGAIVQAGAGETVRGGKSEVRGRSNRSEIFRSRPETMQSKKGVTGQAVQLVSNYFAMETAGKWALYQYRVDFSPDIDHTGARKGMFREAMSEVLNGYLFDGTMMFTPQRLAVDTIEKFVNDKSGQAVRITVKLVGDLAWGDRAYQQVFNIIIRKCLAWMKFNLIGRDFYDPQAKVQITEHKLELWPGYKTSIRQHESQILLNCEMAFKVMRTENVFDMMLSCTRGNLKTEFLSKIVGQIVLTYYNNKTYRIDDVDFNSSPMSTFKRRDGSEISYLDYFQQRYGIKINVRDQPVLVSRSKPREIRAGMSETVVLIPELCQLTGISDAMRNDFHLMRDIARYTRVTPDARIQELMKFNNRLRGCPEAVQELQRYDLKFSNNLIKFDGRVLPAETIIGGNDFRFSAGPDADWTQKLRNCNPVLGPCPSPNIVVISPSKLNSETNGFMSALTKAASGMNMNFRNFKVFQINDDRVNSFLGAIETTLQQSKPDLIMCMLMSNSSDRYSALKKKCCVDRGVPTQVIVARTMRSKGVLSIATKVAIQLNCKLGGAPWTIPMPMSGLMVVGYDVCRDTASKGKCFSAMVASMDKQGTRYFNHTIEHRTDDEISTGFAAFLVLACENYKIINGKYPSHILIYRDGVGDGQLPYVRETEVEMIKKRLIQEVYKGGDLKLAFIVVSKRINTRIFTASGQNAPPGTVVDDVVTLPERYDFFIVSQCVRQGTVSPTSYHVVFDEMGLNPDRLQQLTYKLCHVYYNWSGTIRVPAPVQYAHKLAFLTSQYLHRQANAELKNLLFFL